MTISVPQSHIALSTGMIDSPRLVREYSVFGGTHWIDLAIYQPVRLQLPQLLREHLISSFWHQTVNLAIPKGLVYKMPQDDSLVFPANKGNCCLDGTVEGLLLPDP